MKYRWFLMTVALVPALVLAQLPADDDIDWQKARQLHQREQRGEKLTDSEKTYLERAKQARKKGTRPAAKISTADLRPLTDFSGKDRYKGEDGGLYGGGMNEPPEKHLQAALEQAKQIRPLDSTGEPHSRGKIVLISVGMSNTTQEFSQFIRTAREDQDISPHVMLVDGAQGGRDAESWAHPKQAGAKNRSGDPWQVLEQRLQQADVTAKQVQVAWIKQARRNPSSLGEFPEHVTEMQGHMAAILHRLKERYPNLRIAYLSSRIYAGNAGSPLNPEPYAYESAFCMRRLIQDQINGKAGLNFDPDRGDGRVPLLLWGPYLWANGEQGRTLDDLKWRPEDFAADGTHPSASGRQKVADLLLTFFKHDPTSQPWFVSPPTRRQPE